MELEKEDRGDGEGGDMNKQTEDRRLKTMPEDEQVQPPPQQPQQPHKCPRCESLNTKFCYYNNYSLSQPRYFCRTCRRYWTQGGTFRNIPIGGSCRKGKRAKSSSSSIENSSIPKPQPPPPQEVIQSKSNLLTMMRAKNPSSIVGSPAAVTSISPYYQGGGGYLSSPTAIHSLNPSQPFSQSLNVGGDVVGSSNSGFRSGFNVDSLGSQHQHQLQSRSSQFHQMGNRDREVGSLYPTEQGLIPSSMANSSAASHPNWPQSFINNADHKASDASLWSTVNFSSISGSSESNVNVGSSSLNPNQWPNLPGYGHLP